MAASQAILGAFGIGKESIFGNGVAASVWLPIRGETISEENQFIEQTGIRQTSSEIFPVPGRFRAGGDFTLEPDGENCGLALKALMGAETGLVLNSTVAYRHTFKFGTTPSLSIVIDKVAQCVRYVGSMLTGCRFGFANNEDLLMTFTADCKNVAFLTPTPAPSFTYITPFNFTQGVVTFDGVASTVIESMDITVANNNYADNWTLGSGRTRREIPTQRRTVSGRITILFESATEHQRFWGLIGTTGPQTSLTSYELKLVFDSGVAIGSSGYNYLIRFVLPKTIYNSYANSMTSGQIIKEEIGFRSFETTTGANNALQIELENFTSSIY